MDVRQGPIEEATRRSLREADLPDRSRGVQEVLVKLAQAIDDIDELGLNPAGKLDNVSIPTYLKYAEALGLTPAAKAVKGEDGKPKLSRLAQLQALPGGKAAG